MRVIHVAPTPFGSRGLLGGGERYPHELARALALRVDCDLLTFGMQPADVREPMGLRIQTLRARAWLGGHPAHPIAPGLATALRGADVIHTHHMRSAPSRIAALMGRARGQTTVVTDHGLQGGDWGGLLPRLFDRFLMVSHYSADVLDTPPGRTRVIYGGVDPHAFAPDTAARRSGVLFVGRITPHKGIDRLIEALPAGVPLTVVGSEGHDPDLPEREYPSFLRRLASGRDVHFTGPVPDASLPSLYRQAAVLVLPSVGVTCYGQEVAVSELLGLVVLEAMASGTPTICSRLGGLPEVVEHGVTGFLFEPGNVPELRERIAEVLSNPALAARMGRAARDRVLEQFTWAACADRCLEAYQGLLG